MHFRTAQVKIAVLKPHLFRRNLRRRRQERDGLRTVENDEFGRFDFNFARGHVGIDQTLGARENFARDLNDVFVMNRLDEFEELRVFRDVEDRLRFAVTVANIDKKHPAVVARGVDPTAKRNRFAYVRAAQFAASFSSKHP